MDHNKIIGEPLMDSVYQSVSTTLLNKNASQTTVNVMNYLAKQYGQKVISGQYCSHNNSIEVEAIFHDTGKYPALRGFDFIFSSLGSSFYTTKETELAIEWWKKGGLVTFSWHWFAPKEKSSFYVKETEFDFSKGVTDINIANLPLTEIEELCNKGALTEECYLLVRDIDAISRELQILQENDITVLWRPLHEAAGGWFWWGNRGNDAYLWLWKLMVDRQTNYHKLNNLIWVWNGQNKDWYPGDDYCDIIGNDIYAEKHSYQSLKQEFVHTLEQAKGNKITALSENGVMIDPDHMIADHVYWSWFNVWYGDFIIDKSGNIVDTYTEKSMVNKVYHHDLVITLDQLPKFN
jgi:mannan endo-1,4-beta-mannosidase